MRDALASLPIPVRLLTALLLLLGALVAPHAANLNPLILAFFYIATLWRLIAQRQPEVMPRRWLLMLLMIAAMALVVATTHVADGRLAGTALLIVMLGLKLLELRARRDIHVAVFLGYFLVLTQFLYDQSLPLAIYLFAGVIALILIQVGLSRVNLELRLQLRNTLAMSAGSVNRTRPPFGCVFSANPRNRMNVTGVGRYSGTPMVNAGKRGDTLRDRCRRAPALRSSSTTRSHSSPPANTGCSGWMS